MFLICHKGSYGLSLSPTVLQIFTSRCEDVPETQLWVTIGQWDWHPQPGEQNPAPSFVHSLSLFILLSGGPLSLLSPATSQEVLAPSLLSQGNSREVLSHSCGLRHAPEFPPELSPEVLSSQGIFFCTSAAESRKLQLQQTKRTSPYHSDARSCVAPAISTSSFAKAR